MTDEQFKQLFETLRVTNAEAHAETRRQLGALEKRVGESSAETRERFAALDDRIDESAAETRRVLREENVTAHAETRRLFREEDAETRRLLREGDAETRRLLREENAAAHAETRLHFDAAAERFERKFDLLGDGLLNLDEKLDRETADIRKEMRQGFADTQALIRFSHAERASRRKR